MYIVFAHTILVIIVFDICSTERVAMGPRSLSRVIAA